MRHHKLDKMAIYLDIKSNNPKLKRAEIAKLLEMSPSTIQRYRREINLLASYRIPPSSTAAHTRKQKTTNTNRDDVKVTSIDLKATSNEPNKYKKIKLKGAANIEIEEKILDEIFHKNNL